jgi:hypothetical protein
MCHLRWARPFLSPTWKLNPVRFLRGLLPVLEYQWQRPGYDIVIFDEFCFPFNPDPELISLQPDEEIAETERHIIQSQKRMLMIVSTPSDFHIINVLAKSR